MKLSCSFFVVVTVHLFIYLLILSLLQPLLNGSHIRARTSVLIGKFSELRVDLGTQYLLDEQFNLISKQNTLAYILYLLYLV